MRKLDPWLVVALTWLFSAISITLVFGPLLGLRGWFWLGMHHLLCAAGTTHEIRRAWHRRQRLIEQGIPVPFFGRRKHKARYWAAP